MAVLLASGVIDSIAGWIGVNPAGAIPTTMKKAATVSIIDIQEGFSEFYQKTGNKVLGDVSTVIANYLQDLAASYKASAAAAGAKPLKRTRMIQGRAPSQQLSTYTDFQMSVEDADAAMEGLLVQIDNPALAANLAMEMPQVISNLNSSTAKDAMFTSQKGVKATDLDRPFFSSNPMAPLQGALITAGPTILAGMKREAIQGVNGGIDSFKQAVPVYDWYKFYPIHMCWGFYKHDQKSSNMHEQIVGCGTTANWKNINLAPIVQKLLNNKAQAPAQIGMGSGLESTFEGLRKFTGLIYGINVFTIINLTFALVVTVVAIGATGFVDTARLQTIYFVALNVCVGAMSLVYSNAIVMLLSLGGVAFMMPGAGESLGAIVSIGGGFLALSWLSTILTLVGCGAWMMMWLSLVRRVEFEKGKAAGTATVTMVHGREYEVPKHG
jgi:hypothetical protein